MLGQMRETLMRARMGMEDLQIGLSQTRVKLAEERRELDTVRRRRQMAERIGDTETVAVAERFERQHAERVEILERKLSVQEAEVAVVEREIGEMTTEFKAAHAGVDPSRVGGPTAAQAERAREAEANAEVDAALGGIDEAELDALRRKQARETREAQAEDMLAELKRRMSR